MLVLKEAEQLDDVQIGQGLVERDFLSHFVALMRFLKTGTPGVVTNGSIFIHSAQETNLGIFSPLARRW